MTRRRRKSINALKFAGEVLISVIKALIIWTITQGIQDMLRTRPKSLTVPVWLVVLAYFRPALALFLALAIIGSFLAAVFYKWIWGQAI